MPSGASRWDVNALTPGMYVLSGSFDVNGSSSPASPLGVGYTVTRTGTGAYALVLDDPFRALVSVTVTPQCNTAATFRPEAGAYTPATRTLVIRTLAQDGVSGIEAVADIAAHANNRVHFSLTLAGSSATRF